MQAIAFAVEIDLALEVVRVLSDQHREHAPTLAGLAVADGAGTVDFLAFFEVDRKLHAGDEYARKKQWKKS
jgi:hypothetical protein